MTTWRPPDRIRVIVIGLAWNDGRLLAVEVTDDRGSVKGVRPLGGGIEFGETREEALRREFREELGVEIEITGAWHAMENIFRHEGATGHEIVFAVEVALGDASLYREDRIEFLESNLTTCHAAWFDPRALASAGIALYPTGLAELIGAGG